MTLTDKLQSLWNWFNQDGWMMLLGLAILGFLLSFLSKCVLLFVSCAASKKDAQARAVLAFFAAFILVLLYLYNDEGRWERHLFGKDVWIPFWGRIIFHQAIASFCIGLAVLSGFEFGWTEPERRRASCQTPSV